MIKFIYNLSGLKNFFSEIKGIDFSEGYQITISKIKKKRSIPQNKLYWLYLTCIEQETGNEKDYLHEFFKEKYLKKELIEIFNTQIVKKISTTNLNTKTFTEYLEKIIIFSAQELNITLPDPNDLQINSFIEHYSKYL